MERNLPQPETGTGSLPGDLIVLLLLIIGGVAVAVWFLAMTAAEQAAVLQVSLNLLTLVLIQPGIFLTVKIIRSDLPSRKKVVYGLISLIGVTIALPLAISAFLYPIIA